MKSIILTIFEEFEREQGTIGEVISQFEPNRNLPIRKAISNSLHLLLVASFEQFILDMVNETTIQKLRSGKSDKLPSDLLGTVWKNISKTVTKEIY